MISKKSFIPIAIILLVATGLRFCKFSEQPFTHDEFSTLFRLDFDNIKDVIQIGMKELDNHPIGTQVFYYYYTKIAGDSEMAVKFPILIFGIFSVYLVFLLGRRWFNSTTGLFAASFMAVLQYSVVQSQIARMYGFGIPFILLMVLYWDNLINGKFNFKNAFGYILFAAICSYTHYFCLLMVFIVGITGLFFVERANIKKYIICGLSIFLLFVPHINIFLYQLSKGGIEEWLGPFHFTYFFEYIMYVFHNSWIIGLLVILPIIFFFNKKLKTSENKFRLISLLWLLTPMLIGFTYSFFVNNVVHDKVLYFSFPFLLLFLGSFLKQQSLKIELVLVIAILAIGSWSLFFEREHFYIFNNQRYKLVAESLIDWEKEIPEREILPVKFTYPEIDLYYNKKHHFNNPNIIYYNTDSGIKEFINLLKKSDKEYLYFGRAEIVDLTYLQIALAYYPEMVKKKYTAAGEVYLLKRSKQPFHWPCTFFEYTKYFEGENSLNRTDTAQTLKYVSNDEYIGTLEAKIDTLLFSSNNIIEVSVGIISLDTIGGAKIVSTIEKNGKVIDWRATEISHYIISDSIFNKAMFTIPIPDIRFKKNSTIKFFIWNPNKAFYRISDLRISVRPGNPYIYGETRPIPWRKKRYCL